MLMKYTVAIILISEQERESSSESMVSLDQEFGRKLGEKLIENKKLFWKEVNRERD